MLASQPAGLAPASLEEIKRHQAIFALIARGAIVVSFLHQADALARFGDPANFLHSLAAWAMTLIVDVVTWALGEYLFFSTHHESTPAPPVLWTFGLAAVVAVGLNGAFLWTHRPPESVLPGWASGAIAVAFAVFIPLVVIACGIVRAELEAHRAVAHQASAQRQTLEQQLRAARAELAQAAAQLREARAQAAQHETEARTARAGQLDATQQAAQQASQLAHLQAEARAAIAQLEQRAAQEVGQLRAELEAARAAVSIDVPDLARKMRGEGLEGRAIARVLGRGESTVRGWLRAPAVPALASTGG